MHPHMYHDHSHHMCTSVLVDIRNSKGMTAVDVANLHGYSDIAEFITSFEHLPRGE